MYKVLISIATLLIVISACEDKRKYENIEMSDYVFVPKAYGPGAYAGVWSKRDHLFESADMELKAGGRYIYSNTSCIFSGTSEGTWQEVNGEIVLTSDDEFKAINNENFNKKTGLVKFVMHDRKIDLDGLRLARIGDTLYNVTRNRDIPRCFYQETGYKYIKEYRPSAKELRTPPSKFFVQDLVRGN